MQIFQNIYSCSKHQTFFYLGSKKCALCTLICSEGFCQHCSRIISSCVENGSELKLGHRVKGFNLNSYMPFRAVCGQFYFNIIFGSKNYHWIKFGADGTSWQLATPGRKQNRNLQNNVIHEMQQEVAYAWAFWHSIYKGTSRLSEAEKGDLD